MKKGFTLVEMLAVVLILGLLLVIGVPIYQGIQKSTAESIYESKIANVKAKAEGYSEEHGVFVYDIRKMLNLGLLTPDSEAGDFKDPRDNRDMKCDMVQVSLEDNQYYASVTTGYNDDGTIHCYTDEEMKSMNSVVRIIYYKNSDGTEEYDNGWIKANHVYAGYDFIGTPEVSNVVATWGGVGTPLENNMLDIYSETLLNSFVQLHIEFDYAGQHIAQDVLRSIKMDNESPRSYVTKGPGSDVSANLSYVEWELTDGEGSGVAGHIILDEESFRNKPCESYVPEEIPGDDHTKVGHHLDNGIYYVCVKDNVGNITKNADAQSNRIEVNNVDQASGSIKEFKVESRTEPYKLMDVKIITALEEANTTGYEMCLSHTGYLENCSWEAYKRENDYTIRGFDYGSEVIFYISVKDMAGNISSKQFKYTIDNLQYLDLNGKLNGTNQSNINNLGTCDVYINGVKVKSAVTDYYVKHVPGTTYSIKNCTVKSGYRYKGSAEFSGTIGRSGASSIFVPYVSLYTIKYNLNGASGSVANQIKEHGTNINLATTSAKRTGYTYGGWNTNASGTGSNYGAGSSYSGNGNVTLYAKWNPNTITVTLNNQSATSPGTSKVYYKYNINKYYSNSATSAQITSISKPSKNGYIFDGYTTGTNGAGTKFISNAGVFIGNLYKQASNITLYASWKPAACTNCTVTFNGNGGVWDQKTDQCTDVYYRNAGSTVSDKENFKIPYYRNINGSCNRLERYYANRIVKKNYCASYDVFYKNHKGAYRQVYQCRINHPTTQTSAVKNGVIQSFPVEPYKIGFYFDGWYTAASGGTKINANTKVGQNTTYYAHWIDLANTFDINNYAQSKIVACRDDLFQRLIDTYTAKFRNAVNNSQNFRNAMYDCGSVAASAISNSRNGYPVLRQSGRTTIVSGNGRHASCTCYPNKESKSAMKTCDKPACSGEYDQFVSGVIYSGRIFVLSATSDRKPGDYGTSSSKCGDDDGYGNCENEGKNFEVDGYRSIIMGPSNGEANEVIGWGYCNSRTNNAVLNTNECDDETENRIAIFQDGLRVGLYSCIDKYYDINDGRNDRTYNDFESYKVYAQIFKI